MLSEDDYDVLMSFKSIPELAEYLIEKTNYSSAFSGISPYDLHRTRLERLLRENLRADIRRIMPFMSLSEKKFANIITIGEGLDKVKICLRLIGIGHTELIAEYMSHIPSGRMGVSAEQIKKTESVDDFIELMQNTPYYSALKIFYKKVERQELFQMETALDAYWAKLVIKYSKKYLKKNEAKEISKLYGVDIDLSNLAFLLRCKKSFDMKDEEIYASIIPVYCKLKTDTIARIAKASTYEEAIGVIESETPYGRAFSKDDSFIEKRQSEYMAEMYKKTARRNPYSMNMPISYLQLRRIETNNIVSIAEGIRYGLAPEKIKEYLVGLARGGMEK